MLTPGRKVVNGPFSIAANFQNENRVDVDPDTVTFKLLSPSGVTTTYVFGTDAELVKASTGDYYIIVSPNASGRWFYRWESTGTDKAIKFNGSFIVDSDPFVDDTMSDYA